MGTFVEDLLTQHAHLASERVNFDSLNQEIAEYVLPDHATFTTKDRAQGEKRAQRQYDSTAPLEADRHAAAVFSLAVPNSQEWDGLAAMDGRLNDRDDVQQYFDDVLEVVRAERNRTGANFGEQILDCFRMGGVFGTSPLQVSDVPGGGLKYRCMPTNEVYLNVDAYGDTCRLDRRFKLTAKAAREEFGDEVPQSVKDALEREPMRKFEFLHVIMKNPERKPGYLDGRGMAWVSYEIAIADKKMLRHGGYSSWPVPVYRYGKAPDEWYGRGWAANVLGEIKMVNRMQRSMIRQTEKAADPPLLAFDDATLGFGDDGSGNTPSLGAGDIHWGGMTVDGKPLVSGLYTGADLSKGFERILAGQRTIKDAALTSLFQILLDNPKYTATEYLGRMQEKAQLIGPMVGRSVTTFLGQVVEREIEILNRQGKLPDMPRVLAKAGGNYQVQFNSPLMRLMKLGEVTATDNWLGRIVPFLQVKPELADIPEWEEIMRGSGSTMGVPAKYIKDREVLAEIAKAKAKQAALQQVIAAAGPVSGALKNVAQAGQISREAQIGQSVQALRSALRG